MSHYRNVHAILALSEKYDFPTLVELFETSDVEVLVDDVAFIIISLLAKFSPHEKAKIIAELKSGIVDHEFGEMVQNEDTSL